MIPEYFVFVAAIINFCGTYSYIAGTLKGRTQPNRVTWGMWAVISFIATAAQLANGVGWSTLMVFMTGLGPALIFLFSFANKKAYWKTTTLDYACGGLSALGLAGWQMTGNPDVAIAFSILADLFAAIPTFRKSWVRPESENGFTFIMALCAAIIGVLCVQQRSFSGYAFIGYLVLFDISMLALIYRKPALVLVKKRAA